MTNLLTSKIRWLVWALGATGIVAELAVLAMLAQPAGFADKEDELLEIASCPSAGHYNFAPVLVNIPLELSL